VELAAITRRALDVAERFESHERRAAPAAVDARGAHAGPRRRRRRSRQAHPGTEGVRTVEDAPAALEHELADVLWSVIVIADRCGIDLEAAFVGTMDELGERLGSKP
jgi:hypothetical protein